MQAAAPQLPLQIEDASRPEKADVRKMVLFIYYKVALLSYLYFIDIMICIT